MAARRRAVLPRAQRLVDVQHRVRRHARGLAGVEEHQSLARVLAIEVIRHTAAELVELDPAADDVAVRQVLVLGRRQVLGFEQSELKRNRQPILGPALADAHQALAGLDRGAAHERLQSVEIRQSSGVRLVGPAQPEFLEPPFHRRVEMPGLRLDAGAHAVADKALNRVAGPGVPANHIAGAGTQRIAPAADKGVDLIARGVPALRAARA